MCTAVTYHTRDFYFGRTLDYDKNYGEEVVVTPRRYPFGFRCMGTMETHYAMIGMAHVEGGCPLYYEAVNEKGLCMAGLNFVGNADYKKEAPDRDNVATFEFIPWILGQCGSVEQARGLLARINLTDQRFRSEMPAAQLHWMIADRRGAITVESVKEGIRVYDNPVGVLTNNPPFDEQMFQLNNYMHLSPEEPQNHFSDKLHLQAYSRGMGALGLPGDLSSQSRFVRASFTKMNAVSGDSEAESVNQFFHILGTVQNPRGCCVLSDGSYEITFYTSCCNADRGIYYYTTYENHQITAVDMFREDLEGTQPVRYPLVTGEQIFRQNEKPERRSR